MAWLVIAAVLLLLELHHLAFYALFGTIGGVAAAIVALVDPSAIAIQGAVAVGVALAGVVTVRPLVSKAFARHHEGSVALGVHGGLTGQEAITLDEVGDIRMVGHVRLAGERWLAISGDGSCIAPDTNVLVTAVRGTTLVVWPVDRPGADTAELGPSERSDHIESARKAEGEAP